MRLKVQAEILLGMDESPLEYMPEFSARLLPEVASALRKLATSAQHSGFSMQVASSYRSFERQLLIWNAKALGMRPVLDEVGQPVVLESLSDTEKVFAILRWSALPGASRHHWGTDLDVYDSANMPAGYQVQLTVAETESPGPFALFHQWLTGELQTQSCGFYRPYMQGVGSVSPEPWHLSFAPLAHQYAAQLSPALLREKIIATDIQLKDAILKNLDEIYDNYLAPYQPRSFPA
jgi:LAS superfamily LD-carboxypeptidase LdcB